MGLIDIATVLGIDPGETTGICVLLSNSSRRRFICDTAQCSGGLVIPFVQELLTLYPGAHVAVEKFVVGPRSSRSSSAKAGELTRNLIGGLSSLVEGARSGGESPVLHIRTASQVKNWSTDARLKAAGLLEPTKTARHARDAARHALYSAVADLGFPDPLSKRGGE